MSSKIRTMGAGFAGANLTLNTGGGDKKQGLTSSVGHDRWATKAIQTRADGNQRDVIFYINQLGGVGAGKSQFRTASNSFKPDGVHIPKK